MYPFATPPLAEDSSYLIDGPLAALSGGFFFNDPVHLGQQSAQPLLGLSLRNKATGRTLARCAFGLKGTMGVSPMAAPFGSIEFENGLPQHYLQQFVDALLDKARLAGCEYLRLVHHPHCYAPRQSWRLTDTLTNRGFAIVQHDTTAYIPVQSDELIHQMHAQERRRLLKAQRAGLVASHWEKPPIDTVIAFVQQSRQQQGYSLTLPAHTLAKLLRQFPDRFPVFVVRDGETIASLCICVRVRADILYYFLPADNADYRLFSPSVTMINGLYRYCQQQGITLLDLGLSLDENRQPKPTLAQFKRNMGAVTSPKLTFGISL